VGLELTLTRLVSTLHSAAYVYIVLSVALLGLGLGAALLSVRPRWREYTASFAALAGLSTLLLVLLLLKIPLRLEPLLLFATVPFVFVGLALASIFASTPEQSARLYFADLSGAGLGALLLLPALGAWSVPNTALGAALAFGVAGLLWAKNPLPLLTCVVAIVVLALNLFTPLTALNPRNLAGKPIGAALESGSTIIQTRWDALTRSDLVYNPETDSYALYMDGGAGSVVPDLNRPERWENDIGAFPFASDPPERTFVLGPGGGLDVALAKRAGGGEITAAELNSGGLELVSSLAPEVGNNYDGVDLISQEGRLALTRSGLYDLIFLSHVVTGSAELRTQALSENTLYTRDAFRLYLEHLTPAGQLALKLYDEVTLTRALTTAVQVLSEGGATEAEALNHLVALLDTSGARPVPLLLVRQEAVSREEAVRLGRLAEEQGYALLLLPHLLYPPHLEAVAEGSGTLEAVIQDSSANIRPTTDNRPFFFLFAGPPRLLGILLALSLVLLLGLTMLSAHVFQGAASALAGLRGGVLFAALGTGFMLAEIYVLQRSQLVIGHPTQTLSWVLAVLLVSSSLGSLLLSGRGKLKTTLPLSCAVIAAALGTWGIWGRGLETPFPLLVSLVPLGVVLGVPLAAALRTLSPQQVALAWAVNGVGSVFGSVLALTLATQLGYHAVLVSSIGCYGLAALIVLISNERRRFITLEPSTTQKLLD